MASSPNFLTTPPPPPLESSPDEGPTVVIVVFVSFGFIFFFVFCLFALWCFLKKSKNYRVGETDIIRADRHRRVREAILETPHGPQAVVLSVEEDKHVEEEIIRNEKVKEKKHMHAKSGEISAADHDVEAGQSSSSSSNHMIHQTHHNNIMS